MDLVPLVRSNNGNGPNKHIEFGPSSYAFGVGIIGVGERPVERTVVTASKHLLVLLDNRGVPGGRNLGGETIDGQVNGSRVIARESEREIEEQLDPFA